jgi:flagellar basal body-associated protein FliL
MPDAEKKTEAAGRGEADADVPKKRGRPFATMGVFGGVMLLEGLAIFFCMKMFGAEPDPTQGMVESLQPTTAPFEESRELQVAQVRVQNDNGQRATLYGVTITARVHHERAEIMDDFLKNRAATINDAMGRLIRSADEKHLAEPGLETLKRQIRFELSSLLGDDTVIEQVLIPEFTPLPTGF